MTTYHLCSAMLRIKNEERWIQNVLEPLTYICHKIFILNDRSTDSTAQLCKLFSNAIIFDSPFETLDESRDKNYLYDRVLDYHEYKPFAHGYRWPKWLLSIDGDEVLNKHDIGKLMDLLLFSPVLGLRFKIIYLWNDEKHRRIDGVYNKFSRPSAFQIINPAFRFQKTPFGNGANFHCSSIPQELLYDAIETDIRLNHYGYMKKDDRIRKWKWYNQIDPYSEGEGYNASYPERGNYPHIVQGDIPAVPADAVLKHAGPLQLEAL